MRCYIKVFLILSLFIFQILSHQSIFAQHQQLLFGDKLSKLTICAQYREDDGSMISASRIENSTLFFPKMLLYKTDKSGNVLWAIKDSTYNAGEKMRLDKLRNGDYLVMDCTYGKVLHRIKPDGTVKWSKTVYFSSSLAHAITGFTELPNGNIVVCGYNDIDLGKTDSDRQYNGFLTFFDSTGSPLYCLYYGHNGSSITHNYSFYDVKCFNNKIYCAGGFDRSSYGSISNGLLMVMDLDGKLSKTRLLEAPLITGTDILWGHCFYDLFVTDGQLFVSGGNYNRQLVGRVDTTSFTITGHSIFSRPYSRLLNAISFVNDTNNIYSIMTPTNSYQANRMFITKINKGTVEYCKKIEQDSFLSVNSFFIKKDTAFVGGRSNNYFRGLSSYFSLSDTSMGCGMSDTSVEVNSFSTSMDPPVPDPNVTVQLFTFYPYSRWGSHCVYSIYRCGDTICPSSLIVELDTFTRSEICYGDTFLLVAKGCYPKKWYKNGIELGDNSDVLRITGPGDYKLVITNNACSDTSSVVSIHSKFVAFITISGNTLYSSKGVTYQWLDSSYKKILGATNSYFVPAFNGKYFVLVTDSSGCSQLSEAILYESPLGIHQVSKMEKKVLFIFPNPASSKISIGNYTGHSAMLSIKDITGRAINRWQQKPGLQEYEVSLLGLNAGVYWIQLIYGEFCVSEKIIVLSNMF